MAQQFQSPETYAAGQQLTAARLNNMVNNAVPLPGLIGDRVALTASTLASDDKFLILDTSASAIRSVNASDILSSGIPITTSGISYSGQDIQVNIDDSAVITNASFLSADGNTVTVTAIAHGFTPGGTNLIEVTGAPSTYNGTFVFNYVNANTFTYTTYSTGTPVTSPTVISVKRKGAQRNASSIVTNSHLSVTQQSVLGGTTYTKGSLNVLGGLSCPTSSTFSGSATFTGTTNITGDIQYNGTTVYGLKEIVTYTVDYVAYSNATTPVWTSTLINKPSDEIWEIDVVGSWIWYYGGSPTNVRFYFYNDAKTVQYCTLYLGQPYETGGSMKFIVPAGTALTNEKFKLFSDSGNKVTPNNGDGVKMYIKKYITA